VYKTCSGVKGSLCKQVRLLYAVVFMSNW